jgi:site-specific recombinase XerD
MADPSDKTALAVVSTSAEMMARLESHAEGVKKLTDAAKSTATKRAYEADWRTFEEWCAEEEFPSLPLTVGVVASYLKHLFETGKKVKTIQRAYAGLVFTHRKHGFDWESPKLIKEQMKGIRMLRAQAGERVTKKTAATVEVLRRMVSTLKTDLVGIRNKAILTLTWIACSRRSEIAGLDLEDVEFRPGEGLIIQPRTTKTEQEGEDTAKGIPYADNPAYCPVLAVQAWIKAAAIETGPLFRPVTRFGKVRSIRLSDKTICEIVKNAAERVGLDPKAFGAHSLRAGFLTTSAQKDIPISFSMTQSHQKSETIARGYVRHATLFTKNAAKGLL